MVQIEEVLDWEEEVLVTLDANGRLAAPVVNKSPQIAASVANDTLHSVHRLDKKITGNSKNKIVSGTVKQFEVVNGTVVSKSAHDAIDADIRADVERELDGQRVVPR